MELPTLRSMGNSSARVSEDDVRYLLEHTSFTRKEIVQWCKGFYKDCPNGRLTKDQFFKVYAEFFPHGDPSEFSHHVFRSFDTNKSGYIEFSEFLVAINITSKKAKPDEKLRWAFDLYDIDGNGTIEKSEMEIIIRAIHLLLGTHSQRISVPPEERTEMIFQKIDTNGDGVLTRDEFTVACLTDPVLRQMLTVSEPNAWPES